MVTSGHWCRCDSSQHSSFVLDDMLIWAPVGGHWVKERQVEGKKPKPIIGGSYHKYHFCRDKIRLLWRQKYVCCDKTSSVQRPASASTKVLSGQTQFCRDKHTLIATKMCFVATYTCLSRQFFFTVSENFCRGENDTCGSSRQ